MIKRNVTAGMKYKILERDGFRCIYCGKQSNLKSSQNTLESTPI